MHAVIVAILAPKGAGQKNLDKLYKELRNGH